MCACVCVYVCVCANKEQNIFDSAFVALHKKSFLLPVINLQFTACILDNTSRSPWLCCPFVRNNSDDWSIFVRVLNWVFVKAIFSCHDKGPYETLVCINNTPVLGPAAPVNPWVVCSLQSKMLLFLKVDFLANVTCSNDIYAKNSWELFDQLNPCFFQPWMLQLREQTSLSNMNNAIKGKEQVNRTHAKDSLLWKTKRDKIGLKLKTMVPTTWGPNIWGIFKNLLELNEVLNKENCIFIKFPFLCRISISLEAEETQ